MPAAGRLCLSGQLSDGIAGLADLGFDGLYKLEGIVVALLTNGFDNVVVAVEQGIEAQVATDTLEGVGGGLKSAKVAGSDGSIEAVQSRFGIEAL